MSADDAGASDTARPATVDDLKRLISALAAEQVDYVLIGGYALYALGYQRATTDIDLLLRPTREQGERAQRALLTLPDRVALQLDPAWFVEGETIRVADAFVVDLMFSACGRSRVFLGTTKTLDTCELAPSDALDRRGGGPATRRPATRKRG